MNKEAKKTDIEPSGPFPLKRTGSFERQKSGLLLVSSVVACSLLVYRLAVTGSFYYFFLPWNLFLAWIPYVVSLQFKRLKSGPGRFLKTGTVFAFWLLFLPNSPYLITDLVHLGLRPGIPLWYDAMLVALFAWTGLLLGLISMANAHRWFRDNFPEWKARLLMLFVIVMSSFGIYVGRVLRWNSWDLLVRPLALTKDIAAQFIHPFHHQQTFGMTFSFSLFLALCYYTLQTFSNPLKDESKT